MNPSKNPPKNPCCAGREVLMMAKISCHNVHVHELIGCIFFQAFLTTGFPKILPWSKCGSRLAGGWTPSIQRRPSFAAHTLKHRHSQGQFFQSRPVFFSRGNFFSVEAVLFSRGLFVSRREAWGQCLKETRFGNIPSGNPVPHTRD
jgi:hypothetical protein